MLQRKGWVGIWTIAAFACALLGCDGSSTGPITPAVRGHVKGDTYRNDLLGFEFPTPPGWFIASDESLGYVEDAGASMVSSGDQQLESALDAGKAFSSIVYMVSEHELGAPVVFNPNINFVVEYTRIAPGIKNGADYLKASRLLLARNPGFAFEDSALTRMIGGREFAGHTQVIQMQGMEIRARQYAIVLGDYTFTITLSYMDPAQLAAMEPYLDQLRFD